MAQATRQGLVHVEQATLEHVDPRTLVPWDRNPRENEDAVPQVAASIQRFGFGAPLVVRPSDRRVLAGHTRLKASILLDLAKVPVRWLELSDTEADAYALADNRLGELAEWDDDLLSEVLRDLAADDVDLDALGFDDRELVAFLAKTTEGEAGPDEVPEPPTEPRTKPGDLWSLGDHRLLCGDSTKVEDVARLTDGDLVGICFTSPPYEQQRDYEKKVDDWGALMRGVFGLLPMAEDGQVLVNLGMIHREGEWVPYWEPWVDWMREQGWRRFGWYVWDKITATFKANDGRPYVAHEWVFHFNRNSVPCLEWVPTKHGGEDRSVWGQRRPDGSVAKLCTPGKIKESKPPDTIARVQRETNNSDASVRSHPARFPVAFAEYWIKTWPGSIYEPFSGSGTTIIAAEQLGRTCYALEISPTYVDVAVDRWERFTGRKADRA